MPRQSFFSDMPLMISHSFLHIPGHLLCIDASVIIGTKEWKVSRDTLALAKRGVFGSCQGVCCAFKTN